MFSYEKEYFNVDWHRKLFSMFCITELQNKKDKIFNDIFSFVLPEDSKIFFRLYLAINTKYLEIALDEYDRIQKNDIIFSLYNNLVELLNTAKVQLFEIQLFE